MQIIFHRYGNLCEPDILRVFRSWGIEVWEEDMEITHKNIPADVRIRQVTDLLKSHPVSFIFSINFFPYLSEICERFHLLYVCWSVDCPVLELFSSSLRNRCNRVFLFDRIQYTRFLPENPEGIFYLPLAANTDRPEALLADLTPSDIQRFSSDVSFVGSLYRHTDRLASLRLSPSVRGFLDGVMQAQLLVYGYNFIEDSLTPEVISAVREADSDFLSLSEAFTDTDRYVAANHYVGMSLASLERVRTLQLLSRSFSVALYTGSDVSGLSGIDCRGSVKTLTETPKVFRLSKINLNITMRSIQSGISQRVWDVLACGGFLLSNYQSELPEYFEIGKELDCYESFEELNAKTEYYLTHEDIRSEIARNGYQKVKQFHTLEKRMAVMLQIITDTLS